MAKIEMDISEYKEMEKYAKLLEASLKKQEELQEEIKKLKDAEIKALKQNEKSVTIIKRTESEDVILYKKDPIDFIRYIQENKHNHKPLNYIYDKYNMYTEAFFNKTKAHSIGKEEVIVKGLDKVKEDLRKEINKEYIDKIDNLSNIIEKFKDELKLLKDELIEVKLENSNYEDENNKLYKDLELISEENNKLEEYLWTLDLNLEDLKNSLDIKINIFNFKKVFKYIKSLI